MKNLEERKFVVIRLSSFGDLVLASGVAEALRLRVPEAKIVFLTKKIYRELALTFSGVDEVWSSAEGWPRLASRIRRFEPEAVLDLQGGFRTQALCMAAGRRRIGIQKQSFARRAGVRHKSILNKIKPRIKHYQDVLDRALGSVHPLRSRIRPLVGDLEQADEILLRLGNDRDVIGLAPGAAWATKQWPLKYFEDMAQSLSREYKILVFGQASEAELTFRVARAGGSHALDLGGRTGFALAGALLSRCRGLLTNDSGLLHLAEAVGTPVIALFGSTSPALGFGPINTMSQVLGVDLPCRPCHVHGRTSCPLKHFRCMEDLSPAMVRQAMGRLPQKAAGQH